MQGVAVCARAVGCLAPGGPASHQLPCQAHGAKAAQLQSGLEHLGACYMCVRMGGLGLLAAAGACEHPGCLPPSARGEVSGLGRRPGKTAPCPGAAYLHKLDDFQQLALGLEVLETQPILLLRARRGPCLATPPRRGRRRNLQGACLLQ